MQAGTGKVADLFTDHEVVDDASGWWLFFLTGVAWLLFALIVFQWDYTTVYAVSYLFGVVAVLAGVNELLQIAVSTTAWKIARAVLGALFLAAGAWALVHPDTAFGTLAALIGIFLLCKGVFDLVVALTTKERFAGWWLQLAVGIVEILLAFWVAGAFREQVILLVVYVGVVALTRGVTEILLALKLLAATSGGPLRPA